MEHTMKARLKRFISDLILKRKDANISLVSFLGVELYGYNNQKATQKLKLGVYEEIDELNFLKDNFHIDDVFLDIGANMGIYTILASKYVEKVIAFEPIKKNTALINLSLVNSNSENCLIYQNIVSNQDDKIQFLEVSESELSRAITTNSDTVMKQINDEYGKLETNIDEYKCITIDSLNLDRIDIMKIDVEGFELKVIDGAIETLKRCRPRLIMIEVVESAMVLNGDQPKDLLVVLNKLGYSPKILSKGRLVEYVDQKIPRDNLFFSL